MQVFYIAVQVCTVIIFSALCIFMLIKMSASVWLIVTIDNIMSLCGLWYDSVRSAACLGVFGNIKTF